MNAAVNEVSAMAEAFIRRSTERRQLGRASEAFHDASMALALLPTNPEARLCRALALEELGRLADAAADAGLVLSSAAPTAAARAAASLLRRVGAGGAAASASGPAATTPAASDMEAGPRVSAHRLRLHFGLPLPEPLVLGEWTTISLRLTTEIGLTPHFDSASGAPAFARLMLLHLPPNAPTGAAASPPSVAPQPVYELEVRQAVEDDGTREPRLVHRAARRACRVCIQRGRAVAEVRAELRAARSGGRAGSRDLGDFRKCGGVSGSGGCAGSGDDLSRRGVSLPASSAEGDLAAASGHSTHPCLVHHAVLWAQAEEVGGSDVSVLAAVSVPLRLIQPGTEGDAEGAAKRAAWRDEEAAAELRAGREAPAGATKAETEAGNIDALLMETEAELTAGDATWSLSASSAAARVSAAAAVAGDGLASVQCFRPFQLPRSHDVGEASGAARGDMGGCLVGGAVEEGEAGLLLMAEGSASIASRVWDSGAFFARWLGGGGAGTTATCDGGSRSGVVCEKEKGMSDNPCHPDASFTDVSGCIASSPPPTSPPYLISWRGARVLELGAGVGISGLVAAALGARTLLTDLDEALPLLQLNALINAPLCAHAPRVAVLPWGDVGAAQAAAEAVWGSEECGCAVLRAEAGAATEGMAEGVAEGAAERAAEFAARVVPERAAAADPATAAGSGRAAASTGANTGARGPKIVLCSDLVYDPDQYSPLVATLVTLQRVCLRGSSIGGKGGGRCAGGGGSEQGGGCVSFGDGDGILLLMGHVSRHPDEHLFFREVQQHFAVRVIHGPPLECLNQVPLPVSVTEEGGLRRVAREAEGRGEAAGGPDRPGVGEASVRQRGGSQGQRAADGPESASSIAETAVRVLEMVPHV